ncbi:hypothetical protein [Lapidilactobacillus wuchangensis]|uniref:hypothetical protein n=1 Tax=Lapidilactobacillus wuchangensis TaxID=2486001 RepID=UPI000F7B5AE5|nr:hypothetical protein [Lapidilactobacillus wuchangensis]
MAAELLLATFAATPRRYKAIFYGLLGKDTVSNLLALREYGLLSYFHLYPKLSQSKFQAQLVKLQQAGWLQIDQTAATATLTTAGAQFLQAQQLTDYWPHAYDYWQFGDWQLQWQRLLLGVQVVSNRWHQVQQYQPLTESFQVQQELHAWWRYWSQQDWSQFKIELQTILSQLPESAGILLANSFSSNSFPGLTSQHLAQIQQQSTTVLQLAQINSLGLLLQQLQQTPQQWPMLTSLLPLPKSPLPRSAAQTYQQLLSGQTWLQIVQQRRIKENTLKEHLLMAAILIPTFPFQNPTIQQLCHQDPAGFFAGRIAQLQGGAFNA